MQAMMGTCQVRLPAYSGVAEGPPRESQRAAAAFKSSDRDYPFFSRIRPYIWSRSEPVRRPFSGLYVFPGNSSLRGLVDAFEKERASTGNAEAPDV